MNKLSVGIACLATSLCVLNPSARAQTTANWVGPATGGEWNTPANWDIGVPGIATNAIIATSANVGYNLPMSSPTIGGLQLSNASVLNINAAGFNVESGSAANTVIVGWAGSSGSLNINSGGAMTLTNSGPLYVTTNGLVVVNAGGSLLITNPLATDGMLLGDNKRFSSSSFRALLQVAGGTATIANRLTIAGSTSATSGGGSQVQVDSGTLNLQGGARINNTTDDGGCRVLINGGNVNLGGFSIYKSAPNPGAGLVISNGLVNATGIQIGVGNSRAYGAIYAGTLTNTGTFTVSDTTIAATSGDRKSHFVMLGGTVVSTTPEGIIVGNQANGSAASSSSIGGFLDLSGGTLTANGITLVKDNTIANAYGTLNLSGSAVVYLGPVGLVGNAGAGGSGYFVNFSGGTLAAMSHYTNTANVKLASGTTTIQCADASGNPFNVTASGVWSNVGGLAKTGGGTLLFQAANTYSGATLVNGGKLALDTGGLLASSSIIVGPGTTFDVSALGGSYTLNASQTLAGSGVVTGAVNVASTAIINPGSNALTGLLTFTNDLTETGGAVNHFDLPNAPTSLNNDSVVVGGTLAVSGANTIEINGATSSGAYKLFQYGTFSGDVSAFTLSGATGTISNSVVDKAIYLVVTASIRSPTNIVWVGNSISNNWDVETTTNWLNNGALDVFVPGDSARFDDAGAANPLVNIVGSVAPGSVIVDSTSDYTFTGAGLIGGLGGITKTNSGTLTILTTNSYTGVTTINGGVLEIAQLANGGFASGIGSAVSDAANLVISNGTFRYSGPTVGVDRGATLASAASAIDVSVNGDLTLSGTLTGGGGLTKSGNGTLIVSSANSYAGNTTLSNGTLQVNSTVAAIPNTVVFAGGTWSMNVSSQQRYSNPLNVLTTGTIISAGGNNNIIDGPWSGAGTLNLNIASGTFTIDGNMTTNFTGTVLVSDSSAGTFRLNAGGGSSGAQQATGSPTATFDLGNSTITLLNRNGGGTSFGTYYLGALAGGSGTILRGSANASSASTYQIGDKNLSTTFAGTIGNGTGGSGATVSILKVGTGTLSLSGQSVYTGTTTVSNGVLALIQGAGGDGSISGSAVINVTSNTFLDVSGRSDTTLPLAFNQQLRGRGTLLGKLDTTGGGIVAPGGGPGGNTGIFTATNSILLGGTAWMKLNRANSQNSDRLVSSLSTITYGGTLVVTNVGPPLQAGDTFTLFTGGSLGAGTFGSIVLPNYYTFDTSNLGVNGSIMVTAVLPPPNISSVDFSTLSSGFITLNATNGAPNGPVSVLTTTNLATPLANWTSALTTQFDGAGNLTGVTITADPAAPQQYYILQAE